MAEEMAEDIHECEEARKDCEEEGIIEACMWWYAFCEEAGSRGDSG